MSALSETGPTPVQTRSYTVLARRMSEHHSNEPHRHEPRGAHPHDAASNHAHGEASQESSGRTPAGKHAAAEQTDAAHGGSHDEQSHSHDEESHGHGGHTHGAHAQDLSGDPIDFWERKYASPVWSGNVNATLAAAVAEIEQGFADGVPDDARSLDLGSGEGGDALWLAGRGWNATGVDISPTAVGRAREAAAAQDASAIFLAQDLGPWARGAAVAGLDGEFTLITASFMQSPVELPRELILRRALAELAPGGSLVIVSHAAPPPWAKNHPGDFLSPEAEVALLELDTDRYDTKHAEIRQRLARDPEGNEHPIDDTLVVVTRR